MRGKRIVPANNPPTDSGDEDTEPEWDDEASVTGSGKDFLAATDAQVTLPTYSVKAKSSSQAAWGFSPDPPPMMFLDVLLQICADFREARLILFEIARRSTSLFAAASRRGGLKLNGAALELDKALCEAIKELKFSAEVGRGSYDAIKHKQISQSFASNQQIKDALGERSAICDVVAFLSLYVLTDGTATANRSLRRVEKTVRDGVVETLKTGMIHNEQEIDYDGIHKQTELNKKEAQEACRTLHGVAEDVSSTLRYQPVNNGSPVEDARINTPE
ncbi:hypothetical protein PG996_012328 [Apiospora saccharicola]|uniref:Uncharacterized protein n=1 Tax=Apiospora saccharicola TaxID=335842 RepID=A0ABR1U295_9PEZI